MHSVVHGGTDALGVPAHDFSTNRNACGPCPVAVAALQAAHVAQYPDPYYTDLRAQLAAFHGVDAERIIVGGSSSELIHRITQHAQRSGAVGATQPAHAYGDYAQAARVWGLPMQPRDATRMQDAALHWACETSSPLGLAEDIWPLWEGQPASQTANPAARSWRVVDCAYRPLWLEGLAPARPLHAVWQLWSPNKALGMTGVRAAYAIAPVGAAPADCNGLRALAPSWVLGAHGVAMLQAWASDAVQQWLAHSLGILRGWKAQQLALCARLGWQVVPGHQANYLVAGVPAGEDGAALPERLVALRQHGVKLRDCTSFGLPGHVRLGVLPPLSQAALERAWNDLGAGAHHG